MTNNIKIKKTKNNDKKTKNNATNKGNITSEKTFEKLYRI